MMPLVALIFSVLFVTNAQFLSIDGWIYHCNKFQYYNSTLDMNNTPPIIRDAFQQTDKLLDYLFQKSSTPSLSFGIVYDQQLIYYKSYGVINLETSQKPTADTIYRIASMSKVFTVLMAYKMRQNGLISFDDTVYKYNKFSIDNPWGVTNKEKLGQTLTIKQLASQISGLPREAPCTYYQDCINITTAEMFQRLSKEYLIHPTDVQPSYSNLAYDILGNVLAEYNGKSYNETMIDLIINPLGLKHTAVYLTPDQQKNAATGYYPDGNAASYVDLGWTAPAGQIFSSINDMTVLMKQYFAAYPSLFQQEIDDNYPFIVSPQTLREMLRPVFIHPDQKSGFGSPWEMKVVEGQFVRGKDGLLAGFSSDMEMVPEMKLGVIAMSNSQLDATVFTLPVMEILIPAFKSWMNSMQSAEFKTSLPSDVDKYVGFYYSGNVPIFEVVFNNQTESLLMSSSIETLYGLLMWMGDKVDNGNLFSYHDLYNDIESCWSKTSGTDGRSVQFVTDENGKVTGLMLNDNHYGLVYPKKVQAGETGKRSDTCGEKSSWRNYNSIS